MTSRERMLALLRRDTPDRMGLFESYWPETQPLWKGQGLPEDANVEELFGYDIAYAGCWLDATPFLGRNEVLEETAEHKLVKHGNGAIMRYWKDKSGTPEHVDFDCTTPEQWEAVYKPQLLALNPERVFLDKAKEDLPKAKATGRLTCFWNLFVFETLRAMLGDVVMLESLALDPEWIHDINQTYTDHYIRHMDFLFEELGNQPDVAFIYEDLGYNKGLFCSPAMYRELIFPYHKRFFDYFHERGMPVIMHSCGNVNAAVPLLIEEGVDCLQPLEAKAGMDVVELAKLYGDKLAFMGNIDVQVLERGNKAEIEAEIAGKLEALKALGASYIFHSDHSLTPQVSYASYQYALEVFHAHCNY